MEPFRFALEIVGTIAFSISGAIIAVRKNMDIFGVIILGLVTAVGGGVIRDLILGITPPNMFHNPVYAAVSVISSVIVFFSSVRRLLHRHSKVYDFVLFLMDTLGLSVFTVVGVQIAYTHIDEYNLFLFVFVGVVTGVGGGVLRDMMAQNMPYIFVKHVYAVASLVGALLCVVLWKSLPDEIAMIAGASVIFLIRCLSSHYRWSLPHPAHPEE